MPTINQLVKGKSRKTVKAQSDSPALKELSTKKRSVHSS